MVKISFETAGKGWQPDQRLEGKLTFVVFVSSQRRCNFFARLILNEEEGPNIGFENHRYLVSSKMSDSL
jgi:hypothetical protein